MDQIVCAVVAESAVQAKRGVQKVKIEYEDREPILTIEVIIQLFFLVLLRCYIISLTVYLLVQDSVGLWVLIWCQM